MLRKIFAMWFVMASMLFVLVEPAAAQTVGGEQIETYVPTSWVYGLSFIIPVIVRFLQSALESVRQGAMESWEKAAAAVGLSVALAVIEALTDSNPDTVQSIIAVTWSVAAAQFVAYQLVFKRAFERATGLEVPS